MLCICAVLSDCNGIRPVASYPGQNNLQQHLIKLSHNNGFAMPQARLVQPARWLLALAESFPV
jgi:hypothetical protein